MYKTVPLSYPSSFLSAKKKKKSSTKLLTPPEIQAQTVQYIKTQAEEKRRSNYFECASFRTHEHNVIMLHFTFQSRSHQMKS